MAAHLRQRQQYRAMLRRDLGQIARDRPAERERSGLVDQRAVDLGHALERRAVLDQHAALHQRACRDDLCGGHGKAERARAGDDQHRHRDQQRLVPTCTRDHPSGKGGERQPVHRRGIEPRGAVGDADIARLALRGFTHQPGNIGDRGIGSGGGDADAHRGIDIERPGMHHIIERRILRRALAGEQRQVDPRAALNDHAIGRKALAGCHQHHHAGLQRGRIGPVGAAIGADDHRPGAHVAQQRGDAAASAIAHHAVEPAAAQQEEQQHHRAVEIGMGAVGCGLVQAERGGKRHADADRHVHIRVPVAERAPGRAEEGPPGIGDGRQRDQRRKPVEQVARHPGRARPDRDREQHDVHHRKAADRDRAHQLLARRRFAIDVLRPLADRVRLEPQ